MESKKQKKKKNPVNITRSRVSDTKNKAVVTSGRGGVALGVGQ